MSRKNAPEAKQHDDADHQKLGSGVVALAQVSQDAAAVAAMIGYELPYNKDRIIQEARFYMGQSAEAMLEAGKRLILLKENENHGSFLQIVEEQMGMQERVAQKMMQAAAKYLTNPALASNTKALSYLGKTKLYEMMVMDDETIAELADGGTINGLNLDTIDHMTTRELKAALRETIANAAATEKVLATKNKKIDQVTAQLERRKAETPAEEWLWAPHRKALLDTGETIVNFAQTRPRNIGLLACIKY
jgi:hypothetical protein